MLELIRSVGKALAVILGLLSFAGAITVTGAFARQRVREIDILKAVGFRTRFVPLMPVPETARGVQRRLPHCRHEGLATAMRKHPTTCDSVRAEAPTASNPPPGVAVPLRAGHGGGGHCRDNASFIT
ncbi:hypothetical protein [Streptomyces sp. NPDC050485]|uniref:hypothetical protein n=1 Tax=Streptomyces sp. NPDC050485 TaxID=3365617 RepID=UPI00379346B0